MKRKSSTKYPPAKKLKLTTFPQCSLENINETKWSLDCKPLEKNEELRLADLFASITDWEDFIFEEENPVLVMLKDPFHIWRGGAIIYVHENIIKITLLATFYYYRKQGLGRLLVKYIHHFAHEFQKKRNKISSTENCFSSPMDIIAVVSSKDEDALGFWKKRGFVQSEAKKFRNILHENEKTLVVMHLKQQRQQQEKDDDSYTNFLNSDYVVNFKEPKRNNNLKRYVTNEEELENLQKKIKQMDEGILFETDDDDSDFIDEEEEEGN